MTVSDIATLGVALLALIVSTILGVRGILMARAANVLAREAVKAANEANELASTAESREQERHDVRWRAERPEGNLYWSLVNDGIDSAFGVTLIVDAGAGEVVVEETEVFGHGRIVIDTAHEAVRQSDVQAAAKRWRQEVRPAGLISLPPMYRPADVRWRIYWRTALGGLRQAESNTKRR